MINQPHLVVLAGSNGAGKSTTAPTLLNGALSVTEFVNADVIAKGLSAFEPERAAIQAGRIMLARIKHLAKSRVNFAFETTLASRSFAPWIAGLLHDGFAFSLIFLWLPAPEVAVARVAERIRNGGHSVPEHVIRRRYDAGIRNFFGLYMALAENWYFYDNSSFSGPQLIAQGIRREEIAVLDTQTWRAIRKRYINE